MAPVTAINGATPRAFGCFVTYASPVSQEDSNRGSKGRAPRNGTLKDSAIPAGPAPAAGKMSVLVPQQGHKKPDMFSTMPITRRLQLRERGRGACSRRVVSRVCQCVREGRHNHVFVIAD